MFQITATFPIQLASGAVVSLKSKNNGKCIERYVLFFKKDIGLRLSLQKNVIVIIGQFPKNYKCYSNYSFCMNWRNKNQAVSEYCIQLR